MSLGCVAIVRASLHAHTTLKLLHWALRWPYKHLKLTLLREAGGVWAQISITVALVVLQLTEAERDGSQGVHVANVTSNSSSGSPSPPPGPNTKPPPRTPPPPPYVRPVQIPPPAQKPPTSPRVPLSTLPNLRILPGAASARLANVVAGAFGQTGLQTVYRHGERGTACVVRVLPPSNSLNALLATLVVPER